MTTPSWNEFESYMVVVAHPDDAEFSSAGTIARLTELGKRVVVVQVTSGGKGTPDAELQPAEVARRREAEEREAAKRLGVGHVEFLRATDGEVVADLVLREKIVRQIRTHRPDVVITHDPFRAYSFHSDHRAVGFSTLDSVYPTARDPQYFPDHAREGLRSHKTAEIWFFNAEHPDLFIDITDSFDRKVEALRAHVSQIGTDDGVFDRVRERAADVAKDQDFDLAEAYKVVQMRR